MNQCHLNRHADALKTLSQCKVQETKPVLLVSLYKQLASCYEVLSEEDEWLECNRKLKTLLKEQIKHEDAEIKDESLSELIACRRLIGLYYLKMQNYQPATKHIRKTLSLCRSLSNAQKPKHLFQQAELLVDLGEVHTLIGEHEAASESLLSAYEILDGLRQSCINYGETQQSLTDRLSLLLMSALSKQPRGLEMT